MDLEAKFQALRDILLAPEPESVVRTDKSIIVLYPPEEEHEFRDRLRKLIAHIEHSQIPYCHIDLTGLPFELLESHGLIPDVFREEFEDQAAVKRGLARFVQEGLRKRIEQAAGAVDVGIVLLSGTAALYPVIKFADVLTELRHLPCRIVLAFPGHQREGKLHFMNQRDGYNYLATILS